MASDIGERLKAIREQQGLSQRELAKRTGVTHATVSLIEQNKVSPSISSLKKVLGGLSMSVGDFFAPDRSPEQKIFFTKDEFLEIGGGKISLRQVGEDLHGRSLQMLHELHYPGADTGKQLYNHDGEEGAVVIRGYIEVTVGEQTRVLGPGDAFLFSSRSPHRLRNIGTEVCEIVSACTPPTF
jgi:transcriptional regulator with XRE-family HTH domain